jgi:hypothetical protein
MSTYNISAAAVTTFKSKIADAKNLLDARRPLWNKLTPEKKRSIAVNKTDPVVGEMYVIYKYLRGWFAGMED